MKANYYLSLLLLSLFLNFTNAQSISGFTLVDADTDTDLFEISDGLEINQSQIENVLLNIRANTSPSTIGSVRLILTGVISNTRNENFAPYALFGDSSGDYAGVIFPIGDYTLSGIPYSGSGLSGTRGSTVSITFSVVEELVNTAPIAIANATPLSGDAPLEVNFTGNNSTDDQGIAQYTWNFDDGSTATSANPTHTFVNPGDYEVSLTVEDEQGLSNSTTVSIRVSTPNLAPIAIANATPLSGDAPLEVSFVGSNSTDDQGIAQYTWDFNDGNTAVIADPI